MATNKPSIECIAIVYPDKCCSEKARKKHRETTMSTNPEQLYVDFVVKDNIKKMNNLIFHTTNIPRWRDVFCKYYNNISTMGVGRGCRLTVCLDEKLDIHNPVLTITYYPTKGTVLIQANEENLNSFKDIFHQLKSEVERVKSSDTVDSAIAQDPSHQRPLAPPSPASHIHKLRESLALLEMEFTEFKETTQARFTQLLRVELQKMKEEHQLVTRRVEETMRTIKEENINLRAQMEKIKKENEDREKKLTQLCS